MLDIRQVFTAELTIEQVLLCLVVFLVTFRWYRRPKNFPPGPRGVPVFGVVPWVGKYIERDIEKWSKTYGPLMSLRMGQQEWVSLNDYESIQEAFANKNYQFAGRPKIPMLESMSRGQGVIFIDAGPLWKSQRRFAMKTLRDFGVGTRKLEKRIQEEAFNLNRAILEHEGKSFNIERDLTCATANIMCSVVLSKRFEYDDKRFEEVVHRIMRGFSDPDISKAFALLLFAPALIHLPYYKRMEREFMDDMNFIFEFFKEHISEHKNTFDPENHRDYIDVFLAKMWENKDEHFTDEQLLVMIRDLLLGGTETSSTTLRWALVLLIHFPHTQKRLYQEICSVIGEEGTVEISHKSKMPYTSSFIEELFRFRVLAPIALPHKASEDVKLFGYDVPKGTQVIANLWAVHNDPKHFSEPEKFKPDRFLDDEGNFVKSKYVVPFGVGSRQCLGEQLARMEIFIFLVSFVQKFKFLVSADGKMPELEGASGTTFDPYPFELRAEPR